MDDQEAFRLSCEVAQRINRETLDDPSSPYAGKFVGIVEGKVVVVADDLGTVAQRLRDIEPNKWRTCWIEASRDYSVVIHV